MKTYIQSILLLFFLLAGRFIYSQETPGNLPPGHCGTIAPGEEWENWFQQKITEYKAMRAVKREEEAVITIPVIVHILHNNKAVGTGENIAAAQVQAQLDLMNACFSGNAVGNSSLPSAFAAADANDISIRFCLAVKNKSGSTMQEPGIERIDVSTKSWGDPSSGSVINNYSTLQGYFNNTVKPATIWDPTKYFNIWIGNFISNSGNYLGFATFPPSSSLSGVPSADIGNSTNDGVVMGTGVFGNKAKYANGFYYNDNGYIYGITSLHEVGHYLGLRHISGDASCGNDYCNDTPPQKGGNAGAQNGLNWRCPTHPFQANGCGANLSPNGEMFQNFMDYSDDGCRSLFTADQETRMMTAMTNSPQRKLLGTHGLCDNNVPAASAFSADKTSGCTSLLVTFKDESTENPTSWSWDFGDGGTSAQQHPTHTYAIAGKYTVKLTASNPYGGNTVTKNQYIVVGSGAPYASVQAGPIDNTLGAGGNFNTSDTRGLLFDVLDTLSIESVKVYSMGAGARTIQVLDGVGGNVVHSKTITIPDGENRIALGFSLLPANQYFIKVSGATVDLYRNSAGAVFPYTIPGLISITQTDYASTNPNYYYYFYDWTVRKQGCNLSIGMEEIEVPGVQIYPNPAGSYFEISLQTGSKEETFISLFNYQGQEIKMQALAPGNRNARIDIETLPRGIYLVKVHTGNGTVAWTKLAKL